MQDKIQQNDWKTVFLNIEDNINFYIDLFWFQGELTDMFRSAGIPIDNYINDVFEAYTDVETLTDAKGKEEYKIANAMLTEFRLNPNFKNYNNITYIDLINCLDECCGYYNNNAILFTDTHEFDHIGMDSSELSMKSYIDANVDNSYLIYVFEVYKGNKLICYLTISDDNIGRIVSGYGFGYNKLVKEDYDNLLIGKMNGLGLELK